MFCSVFARGILANPRLRGRVSIELPRKLPLVILGISLGSIAFHATMVYWLHALDLAIIFLFTGFLLAANLCHGGLVAPEHFGRSFFLLAVSGALLAFVDPRLGFAALAAQGLGVVWSARRIRARGPRRELATALVVLIVGVMTLLLDQGELACTVGAMAHIVQPHTLWHVLSATSLIFFYRYERQLERAVRAGTPSLLA